jgi:hypothetical protein
VRAQSFFPSAGTGNIVGPINSPNSGPTMPIYNRAGKLASGQNIGSEAYAYSPAPQHRLRRVR